MQINSPLCITSRLLPGCRIGGATISIEYTHVTPAGRQAYRWFIDNGNGHRQDFQGEDLQSGVGGGTLQEGLESLLGYLGAFAEAIIFERRMNNGTETEGGHLFPKELADWAIANADEISIIGLELQEHPGELIIE